MDVVDINIDVLMLSSPCVGGGGRIRPPYPCVSYEATKRVSWWQRIYKRGTTPASCVTSTGMPAQNAADTLKPLVPNPHPTPLQMVQHVADLV